MDSRSSMGVCQPAKAMTHWAAACSSEKTLACTSATSPFETAAPQVRTLRGRGSGEEIGSEGARKGEEEREDDREERKKRRVGKERAEQEREEA